MTRTQTKGNQAAFRGHGFIYVNDAPRRRTASTKKNRPGHVAPAGEYPKVGHGVSA